MIHPHKNLKDFPLHPHPQLHLSSLPRPPPSWLTPKAINVNKTSTSSQQRRKNTAKHPKGGARIRCLAKSNSFSFHTANAPASASVSRVKQKRNLCSKHIFTFAFLSLAHESPLHSLFTLLALLFMDSKLQWFRLPSAPSLLLLNCSQFLFRQPFDPLRAFGIHFLGLGQCKTAKVVITYSDQSQPFPGLIHLQTWIGAREKTRSSRAARDEEKSSGEERNQIIFE